METYVLTMTNYETIYKGAEYLKKIIVDSILKDIAFEHFKIDYGTSVHKVLPDRSDDYYFKTDNFSGLVDPDKREFTNQLYNGVSIVPNRISANPEEFRGISDDLFDLYWETFGDNIHSRDHPGEPDFEKQVIEENIENLVDKKDICASDPLFDDLIESIKDRNYRMAAQFLNVDMNPQSLLTPGGEHELTELFTQGDIHIVYRDREVALLKPQYNHEIRERVLNQQRNQLGVVQLRGEQPELAFVVGLDDTPTGLFVHSVDGTRLNKNQSVNREQIHNVMGFDYNYEHQQVLDYNVGDRVRLQGDLAVEYIESYNPDNDIGRCNLPIDNHLCMFNHAKVLNGKDQEPIEIECPSLSNLNIMHDEHENVSVELPAGRHNMYLLPRGLKLRENRPRW